MANIRYVNLADDNPDSLDIVVDASGHVVGRLASLVAKWILEGRRVTVVNVERGIVTGDPHMVVEWYKRKISEWRTHYNPEKVGPKVPRRPDRVFKRVVRGMVPRKAWRGRQAMKRLRVYMGVPLDLLKRRELVLFRVEKAVLRRRPGSKYVTLEDLWRSVDPPGWEKWRRAVDRAGGIALKGGEQ